MWSDFAQRQLAASDERVLIGQAEPLWKAVLARVVDEHKRVLLVGPRAVAAGLAMGLDTDVLLRSVADARAAEGIVERGTVYSGCVTRATTDTAYDLVVSFDMPNELIGPETDPRLSPNSLAEQLASLGSDVMLLAPNQGSLVARQRACTESNAARVGAWHGEAESQGLTAVPCFGDRALCGQANASGAVVADAWLHDSQPVPDVFGAADAIVTGGQVAEQCPTWLWLTPSLASLLPEQLWVESDPFFGSLLRTDQRVLSVDGDARITEDIEKPFQVAGLHRSAPAADLPRQTAEMAWVVAATSPGAMRRQVQAWSAALDEWPAELRVFGSPDLVTQDLTLLDLGWRLEEPVSADVARAVGLRRFARRLLVARSPHQWHALSTFEDIAESLLLMAGVEPAAPMAQAAQLEQRYQEVVARAVSAEAMADAATEGADPEPAALAKMDQEELRRLTGFLSAEVRIARDRLEADAVRARSQDWRIGKLTDELTAYQTSLPYKVHRILGAPKRMIQAKVKGLVNRVLPTSARAKLSELLRRAQRESGQQSS